jgi:hypothetical protein
MPVTVIADTRRSWIVVRVTGSLTLDDVLTVIRTARNSVERQMWPMIVDACSATTSMTEDDVAQAAAAVQQAVRERGPRGHLAIVSDDDVLYARMLLYEARCAEGGVRVIRAFRQLPDAERWLGILSAARYFG